MGFELVTELYPGPRIFEKLNWHYKKVKRRQFTEEEQGFLQSLCYNQPKSQSKHKTDRLKRETWWDEYLPCSYTNPSKLEHPGPPLSQRTTGSFDGFLSDSTK